MAFFVQYYDLSTSLEYISRKVKIFSSAYFKDSNLEKKDAMYEALHCHLHWLLITAHIWYNVILLAKK